MVISLQNYINEDVYLFMRMRKKKNADSRIAACGEFVVEYPQDMRGIWHTLYDNSDNSESGNSPPLYLEIGCGKGDFICGMAQKYPEINFIAIEKISDVAVIALEKVKSLNLGNVRIIINDAANLREYFSDGEISRIYLNFSDPWKKRYQHNKRLTHLSFLEMYKKILVSDAAIFFKTDNIDLFDFSVKSFRANGFDVENITYDLHSSELAEDNIMTEYEKNFVSQNVPICRLEAMIKSI